MSRLSAHYRSILPRINAIEARAPGARQFLQDILLGDEMLDELLDGMTNDTVIEPAPAAAGLARRAGSGIGAVSTQVASQLSIFAQFSTLSYCNLDALRSWSCTGCGDSKVTGTRSVRTFSADSTGMQGYVGISDRYRTIVVSFRGSKNFLNWLNNLKFLKADLNLPGADASVKIHSGFFDVWNSVKDNVRSAVREFLNQNPSYTVTFVGHSLGGATTTLAAVDAAVSGLVPREKIAVYTQGSPRVGNINFYNYFSNLGISTFRGVNYNDAVVYLPPQFLAFNHVKLQHWISGSDKIVYCDDITNNGEDTNCANSAFPWISTSAHGQYFGVSMGGLSC
ncbi:Alpha/Beta hydrolase protein [Chytridium lagenaria]|nr:Alpha/Beta hydrolase protein [Chytridium lagenaria]